MNDILQDLSPHSLMRAIEANISAWVSLFGLMGRWTEDEPRGVKRVMVDQPVALFNSIVETRLEQETVPAAIGATVSDALRRKVPVLWWIGPSTLPADLGTQLISHDFTLESDVPGMAVVLASLKENLPVIGGLTIRHVEDDAGRWEWVRTREQAIESPQSDSHFKDAWYDFLGRATGDRLQSYTAYLDGRPVATSQLYLAAGVAGIYAVATVPEARRKGIGTQITLHPLLEARRMGYKAGVLDTSKMGEGIYRSLGFKEYCRIQSYEFNP